MNSIRFAILGAVSLLSCLPPSADRQQADLVLRGGVVHSLADGDDGSAEALAVLGDRIAAVGSEAEVGGWVGDGTEVIDLDGATVIPGLIESHGHFLGLGEMLRQLDLTGAATWAEVVDLTAATATDAEPGVWILGRGWHQEKWTETPADAHKGFPVHTELSAASPDHPVILTHASGHAAIVNAKAMEVAGIDAETRGPEGGEVVLGPDGKPTGLLVESAAALVWRAWNQDSERSAGDLDDLVAAASAEAARHGITTFVDAGTGLETLTAMAPLFADGVQPLRLWAMIRDGNDTLAAGAIPGGNAWFHVGGIKVSLDGALGSRGAWLLEPYADAADETGFQLVSLESLQRTAEIALERDLQLCVHAIGDRANREVLNVYERAFDGNDGTSLRWRVEHAQNIHPDDLPRFAELGVIASIEGIHCTSDGPWVPQRLGEKRSAERAYRWRDLLDSGAVVVNGTDVPVEPVDPFASLAASIDRKMDNGEQFYPAQAMTPLEALVSYTRAGAWAIERDGVLGTLEVGKLADLVVLDRDPLEVDSDSLRQTRVLRTVLGGRTVYEAE